MNSGMGMMGMMNGNMTQGSMANMGGMLGLGVFGVLFGILLLALMVVGLIVLIRSLMHPKVKGNNFIGTLRERYAKGEIDQPTFERLKHDLAG